MNGNVVYALYVGDEQCSLRTNASSCQRASPTTLNAAGARFALAQALNVVFASFSAIARRRNIHAAAEAGKNSRTKCEEEEENGQFTTSMICCSVSPNRTVSASDSLDTGRSSVL